MRPTDVGRRTSTNWMAANFPMGGAKPFLSVGLHLWVRELRRMVCRDMDVRFYFPAEGAQTPGVADTNVALCGHCGHIHAGTVPQTPPAQAAAKEPALAFSRSH